MKLSDSELLELGFDRKAFMLTPLPLLFDPGAPTYLYVLRTGEYHKIGIAADVAKRMESVRTHNPLPVAKVHSIRFQSRLSALLVERTTHDALAPYRMRGEWFSADWATIKRVLLPIAAAARVLRERHMLEWKRQRIIWERENPDWQERGEDACRIPAHLMTSA